MCIGFLQVRAIFGLWDSILILSQMTFGLPNLQRQEVIEGVRQDELSVAFTTEVSQWRVRPLPIGELLAGWFRYVPVSVPFYHNLLTSCAR
jgi:hypothetical protein